MTLITIIIVLIIISILWSIFKNLFYALFGVGVIAGSGYIVKNHFIGTVTSLAIIVLVVSIIAIISNIRKRLLQKKDIKTNKSIIDNISQKPLNFIDIDKDLYPFVSIIFDRDEHKNKFSNDSLPWGRINAFLNIANSSIFEEEPYIFCSNPSKDVYEFFEYGFVICRSGLFVSSVIVDEEKKTESNTVVYYPFEGLKDISFEQGDIIGKYIDGDTFETKECKFDAIKRNKDDIYNLYKHVVEKEYGLLFLINDLEYKKTVNKINHNEIQIDKSGNERMISSAIGASANQRASIYNETKNFMNGSRGNGYAAEYGNNTIDRILGKDVRNLAVEEMEYNGHQVKHGADRMVDGIRYQTKYYQTASESIGAAFEHGESIYIDPSTGKQMVIEVPRDQYTKAVEIMQKRIDRGEVTGVKPGEDARNYVKKGWFTYQGSWNIAKAGTIESLTVDSINGAICSSKVASITAIIVYAQAILNGETQEDAIKASINASLQVFGKGTIITVLTQQLSRSQIGIPFTQAFNKDGSIGRGVMGIENPLSNISDDIAYTIQNSPLAKTEIGQKLGLDEINGKALLGNTITFVVVFGPDVIDTLNGRISGQQLLKNSAVGAASIAGAIKGTEAVASIFAPVSFLGGIIGGAVVGFAVKQLLDNYIEDDSKMMFKILKEEFIDQTMMSMLSKEEFTMVTDGTVASKDLDVLLKDMYQSGDYRNYAREAIIKPAIIAVLSSRSIISTDDYEKALISFIHDDNENKWSGTSNDITNRDNEPQKASTKKDNSIFIYSGAAAASLAVLLGVYHYKSNDVVNNSLKIKSGTEIDKTTIDSDILESNDISIQNQTNIGNVNNNSIDIKSEYIFKDSDSYFLSDTEINNLTQEQARMAINEIAARHGRIFQDPKLDKYFSSKSWYKPTLSKEEYDLKSDNLLNEYEQVNTERLLARKNGEDLPTIKSVVDSRKNSNNSVESTIESLNNDNDFSDNGLSNNTSNDVGSEYICEYSDIRYLSNSEISSLTQQQARMAINEIAARHGRIFQDPEINNYFSSKSWYKPTLSKEEYDLVSDDLLNEYEQVNTERLLARKNGEDLPSIESIVNKRDDAIYGLYYNDDYQYYLEILKDGNETIFNSFNLYDGRRVGNDSRTAKKDGNKWMDSHGISFTLDGNDTIFEYNNGEFITYKRINDLSETESKNSINTVQENVDPSNWLGSYVGTGIDQTSLIVHYADSGSIVFDYYFRASGFNMVTNTPYTLTSIDGHNFIVSCGDADLNGTFFDNGEIDLTWPGNNETIRFIPN